MSRAARAPALAPQDVEAIVGGLGETNMEGVQYLQARLAPPFCVAGVSGPVTLCYFVRQGPLWLELERGARTALELPTGAVVGASGLSPHWFKSTARSPRRGAPPLDCRPVDACAVAEGEVDLIVGVAPIESLAINFGRTGAAVVTARDAPAAHRRIWHAWRAIEDELLDPSPAGGAALAIRRHSEVIQLNFIREVVRADARQGRVLPRSPDDMDLMRAIAAAANGAIGHVTVAALAKVSGMSRSSFFARFREMTGQPPVEAITHMRLRKAAAELLHTRRAVADIAEAAGYGSVAAFTRAFARHAGTTPARWRRSRARTPA